jgi:hypothetical protein
MTRKEIGNGAQGIGKRTCLEWASQSSAHTLQSTVARLPMISAQEHTLVSPPDQLAREQSRLQFRAARDARLGRVEREMSKTGLKAKLQEADPE